MSSYATRTIFAAIGYAAIISSVVLFFDVSESPAGNINLPFYLVFFSVLSLIALFTNEHIIFKLLQRDRMSAYRFVRCAIFWPSAILLVPECLGFLFGVGVPGVYNSRGELIRGLMAFILGIFCQTGILGAANLTYYFIRRANKT
jgi:hypothetical protein